LKENESPSNTDLLEELRAIQTFAALRPSDRIIMYMGAVFSKDAVTNNEVEACKGALGALAPSAIQQRHLIAAIEWFCGTRQPTLLRYFPVMLKHAYDADLVDEDTVIDWARAPIRNDCSAEESMISDDALEELKMSAKPFITWLEEAESDDDDDDEEEEED
jgi:translation initiation factor 5